MLGRILLVSFTTCSSGACTQRNVYYTQLVFPHLFDASSTTVFVLDLPFLLSEPRSFEKWFELMMTIR